MAAGLIGKFATVGGATMASRVMGFAREAMMAAALGTGPVADAFYTAFRFPNVFRRLFAEGAFNIAFVPLYAEATEGEGEDGARVFAAQVFAVLATWLIVLTVAAMAAMPFLVATVLAPGFTDTPDKFDLTVDMTRIMFPYLAAMSLTAMLSGMLNTARRYFLAAIVPVLLNVILVSILAFALWSGWSERETGLALAWGVLVSGGVQLAFLVWGVWRNGQGFRFAWPRATPKVRRLLVLMGPALLTGGVMQINILVGTIIATAQDGANALLNYADRLNQLPLGVIGIAVGVVLLPELSRALTAGERDEADRLQNRSLEFALALTLPAAAGFLAMGDDIVRLLYRRGDFDEADVALTTLALQAFALGLPAYVATKVFQPAYFARQDMRTPFWFSVVMVVTNIALSLALFPSLGHVGIALATAVSAWVNLVLLAGGQWRRGDFRPAPATVRRIALLIAASFAMAAVILAVEPVLLPFLTGDFLPRAVATLGLIALGATVYAGAALATGAVDRGLVMAAVRRRGLRRGGA